MDEEIAKARINLQQEMTIFHSLVMHKGTSKQLFIRWAHLWHAAHKYMQMKKRQSDLFVQG
jgi:hypothetical protein